MSNRSYFVYIVSNVRKTVLYVGITNDLESRLFQHKIKLNKGFTKKYNCDHLVYYEEHSDVDAAIRREKQLKRYRRKWKEDLINEMNPEWVDLAEGWYDPKEFQMFIK